FRPYGAEFNTNTNPGLAPGATFLCRSAAIAPKSHFDANRCSQRNIHKKLSKEVTVSNKSPDSAPGHNAHTSADFDLRSIARRAMLDRGFLIQFPEEA